MNDNQFDELLEQAGQVRDSTRATTTALLRDARLSSRRSNRVSARRIATIGAVSVAGLCLAAAASSQLWSKVAPFTELAPDMYRPQSAIPVDFTMSDGRDVRCKLFPEFLNLSVAQSTDADRVVTGHDWSRLGQQVYDATIAPATDVDIVQSALTEPLIERVRPVALADMPYLAASPIEGNTTHATTDPAWSGFSLSCGSSFAE